MVAMRSRNVPALRLEGFDGAWKTTSIGAVSALHNGRDYKHLGEGCIPVYGTGGYMVSVDQALSHDEDAVGIGRKGTISKPYILKAPFWTVDTLFYVVPNQETDLAFFYASVLQVDWMAKNTATGLPSLTSQTINSADISIPHTLEEQQAIGAIFTNLDDAINQHTKKHQALQQAKTALMQRMFPQEGQTVPELRLDGFDGEWKESSLNDHVEYFSGLTYSPGDVVKNGGTLVLRSSNVKDATLAFDDCVYVRSGVVNVQNVKPNDIIMVVRNGSRALIGKHALVSGELPPTVIGAFMTGLRSKQPHFMSALFDTELFESQVAKSMGATINQITGGMFAKMHFLFPPTLEEQQAIGAVFTRLDTLIATEAKYIESLKQAKAALLQRMFI